MSESPVTITYGRLPTQGVVYGISAHGLAALFIAVMVCIGLIVRDGVLAGVASLPITGPLAALGLVTSSGEPLITHALRESGGLVRQMTGATRFRHRPEQVRSKPVPSLALDIPGRDGRLFLYETGTGAVVVWDARAQTATICCMVATPGLGLPQAESPSTVTAAEREALIYEWARVLGSFTQKSYIKRVVQIEHTRPSSVAAERLHFESQTQHLPPGTPLAQSYREALEHAESGAVLHATMLSITFTMSGEAKSMSKGAGGGKAGMLRLAELEMGAVADALSQAGFQRVVWMSPREWGAWGRSLIDPAAQHLIDSRIGTVHAGVTPEAAVPMLIDDRRSFVETDSAWHRTYWIYQWPRYETYPGFMSSLVLATQQSRTPVRHTIALVGTPTPVGQAMKQIDKDKRTWITNHQLRAKTGRPASEADTADWRAIQQHEANLVAGQGELRLSAYLTVTALDRDGLETEAAAMLNACARAGLEPRLVPWQQAEALLTVAYPCGLGMK